LASIPLPSLHFFFEQKLIVAFVEKLIQAILKTSDVELEFPEYRIEVNTLGGIQEMENVTG